MMIMIPIWSFLMGLLISSPVNCTFICPTPANWISRANETCLIPRYYHCLSNSEGTNYTERCLKPIQLPKGTYPVYAFQTSGNLVIDAMPCPTERFQNNTYMSNQPKADKCPYQKSNCSGGGQIMIVVGSGSEDNICVCDMKHGYSFIEHVEDNCKPGFQNCSCFKNITSFTRNYNETEVKHHDMVNWQKILVIAAPILMLIFIGVPVIYMYCSKRRLYLKVKETAYGIVRSPPLDNQLYENAHEMI